MPHEARPVEAAPEAPPVEAAPAVASAAAEPSDVPGGTWLERLEAVRRGAGALPPKPPSDVPPPLPAAPAHRLVSSLASTPPPSAPAFGTADVLDEISSAKIEMPAPVAPAPRHHWREAVWGLLLVVLVAVGLTAAYFWAQEAEAPVAEVDPALSAERARLAKARSALEEGHQHNLEGVEAADAAIAAYERALAVAPELGGAERGLAIAYTKKGDKKSAVAHYRRYLELEPDAKDAAEVRKIIRSYEKRRGR